jgi:hypothetical protein
MGIAEFTCCPEKSGLRIFQVFEISGAGDLI